MKKLEKQFTGNYDKVGINTFKQIRKQDGVAIYQRINANGTIRGYEVFIVKTVEAGSPLPGGGTVKESYEQYPGSSAFGRTAYDCRTLEAAEQRFDELAKRVATSQANAQAAAESGTPKRRGRTAKAKPIVNVPKGRFTMKMLIASTGLSQPVLHPIVSQWIANATVSIVDRIKAEGGRGRPSMVYQAL